MDLDEAPESDPAIIRLVAPDLVRILCEGRERERESVCCF